MGVSFMVLIIAAICCLALGGIIALIFFVIGIYNNLVQLRTLVEEAWSGIDVQLKKRYDLIPNLVNTVKGYAEHEKDTLEKVTKYRSIAMNAETPKEQIEAENQLSATLKSLFAVSENYPDLKADSSFLNLQAELSDVEDDLEKARRYYNGTVREFNIKIDTFPNNLIAGMLGFSKKPFFEAEPEARENVKVDFSEASETNASSPDSSTQNK
jgi:LemA protein